MGRRLAECLKDKNKRVCKNVLSVMAGRPDGSQDSLLRGVQAKVCKGNQREVITKPWCVMHGGCYILGEFLKKTSNNVARLV